MDITSLADDLIKKYGKDRAAEILADKLAKRKKEQIIAEALKQIEDLKYIQSRILNSVKNCIPAADYAEFVHKIQVKGFL